MKFKQIVAGAALAAAAIPGLALAQVALEPGAKVFGPSGGEVGVIASVADGSATVDTGTQSVALPANVFAEGPDGPVISVDKATLNQLAMQAAQDRIAARDAALVEGAAVAGTDGATLGTVSGIEGNVVTVDGEMGAFTLNRDMFTANGAALTARVTATEVAASLNGGAQ